MSLAQSFLIPCFRIHAEALVQSRPLDGGVRPPPVPLAVKFLACYQDEFAERGADAAVEALKNLGVSLDEIDLDAITVTARAADALSALNVRSLRADGSAKAYLSLEGIDVDLMTRSRRIVPLNYRHMLRLYGDPTKPASAPAPAESAEVVS